MPPRQGYWQYALIQAITILIAKINTNTGEISPMQKYTHPKIERKRVGFAASVEYGLYVECYNYHDLITIL
jgi:hypothetical protein